MPRVPILQRRGPERAQALDRWEIGFAPDGWQNLWDALASGKNVPEDDLIIGRGAGQTLEQGRQAL